MKPLEAALNQYLALDPETPQRLQKLAGKIVKMELLGIGMVFYLVFTDQKIEIKFAEPATPDTVIKGSPLSLLHMALTTENRKQFFADDVTMEGNLDLGQHVIDLFDQLDIDWEDYLSRWVGDVPAYQFARFSRGVKDFFSRTREIMTQNVNEYVHEEAELFPAREALHDFFQDIDTLRMDVDRLEARVEQLLKKIRHDIG